MDKQQEFKVALVFRDIKKGHDLFELGDVAFVVPQIGHRIGINSWHAGYTVVNICHYFDTGPFTDVKQKIVIELEEV